MTHAEYLEAHHKLTEDAYAQVNAFLGEDSFADAKATLVALRSALDALWEQRLASAGNGIQ